MHCAPTGEVHTAWIPVKYAVVDKVLSIKIGDTWKHGFKVLEVYQTVWTREDAADARNNQKRFDYVLGN
jgi:hypothetical protein